MLDSLYEGIHLLPVPTRSWPDEDDEEGQNYDQLVASAVASPTVVGILDGTSSVRGHCAYSSIRDAGVLRPASSCHALQVSAMKTNFITYLAGVRKGIDDVSTESWIFEKEQALSV